MPYYSLRKGFKFAMGIFDKIKKYFEDRRLKRLETDILTLNKKIRFNPFSTPLTLPQYNTTENYTRYIAECKAWSSGSAEVIREFYISHNPTSRSGGSSELNYFWRTAPPTSRFCHSGVPSLISTRMGDILFGHGMDLAVVVKTQDGTEIKDKSEDYTAFLKMLAEDYLKLSKNLQKSAFNESSLGHCFLRLSLDLDLSPFPILESFDLTQAEVIKNRDVTTAIIFKSYFNYNKKDFRLEEIYSTNDDGDAIIKYRLIQFDKDRKEEVEVPLLSVPEVAKMLDGITLNDEDCFVLPGLKGMLAFEKPNKTPSTRFDTDYGESDYASAINLFDAIDEVVSENIHEIRTNRTQKIFPRDMIPVDPQTGEPLPPDPYNDSHVATGSDQDQNAEKKVVVTIIPDKTASFFEKWKQLMNEISNIVGISPYSLGMTYNEAVQPSADSQREREKITILTREKKLKLWKPVIEQLLTQALKFCKWIKQNALSTEALQKWQDVYLENKIIDEDLIVDVSATFGEYIKMSESEKANMHIAMTQGGVESLTTAIKELHGDWTEKQRNDELNEIRYEKGVDVESPDNLPELTGTGEDEE